MGSKALITGGAGFIGSHLADHLLEQGYQVRVLDSLEPQVHPEGKRPDYLNSEAELLVGAAGDREILGKALDGIDTVFHLASTVGVGQSMYEIARYTQRNVMDTAVFLEHLSQNRGAVKRMVVASSMSLYGEGLYRCPSSKKEYSPLHRPESQLKARQWELRCEDCEGSLEPIPTHERKLPQPTSVYSINKRDQEEMCIAIGRAYGIPTVALRFFNAFGSRQSLSNPYTGVAAIFAGRLLNKRAPIIFEDGKQSRDFIHISDLVRGIRLAAESEGAAYEAINLGAGKPISVLGVAETIAKHVGFTGEMRIENRFRQGDTRHCYADASKAKSLLGFEPTKDFSKGMEELLAWLETQNPEDHGDTALEELEKHKLTG